MGEQWNSTKILGISSFEALRHLNQHGWMVRSSNASFIAWVSKEKRVLELKDYRPVSLIVGLDKIASEVLAEALEAVMVKLVTNN